MSEKRTLPKPMTDETKAAIKTKKFKVLTLAEKQTARREKVGWNETKPWLHVENPAIWEGEEA